MIPAIPIADVLDERADAALREAAARSGFLRLSGVDAALDIASTRHALGEIFRAPEAVRLRDAAQEV